MRYIAAAFFSKGLKKTEKENMLVSIGSLFYELARFKNKMMWLVKGKQTIIEETQQQHINDMLFQSKYLFNKKKYFGIEGKFFIIPPLKEKEMADMIEKVLPDEIKKSIFKKRKEV